MTNHFDEMAGIILAKENGGAMSTMRRHLIEALRNHQCLQVAPQDQRNYYWSQYHDNLVEIEEDLNALGFKIGEMDESFRAGLTEADSQTMANICVEVRLEALLESATILAFAYYHLNEREILVAIYLEQFAKNLQALRHYNVQLAKQYYPPEPTREIHAHV